MCVSFAIRYPIHIFYFFAKTFQYASEMVDHTLHTILFDLHRELNLINPSHLTTKIETHCSVLVDSRNRFECDLPLHEETNLWITVLLILLNLIFIFCCFSLFFKFIFEYNNVTLTLSFAFTSAPFSTKIFTTSELFLHAAQWRGVCKSCKI